MVMEAHNEDSNGSACSTLSEKELDFATSLLASPPFITPLGHIPYSRYGQQGIPALSQGGSNLSRMGFDNVPVKRGNEFVEENADGGVRRRVMDVELVMRRELAHREKLEKLQPLTPNESQRSSPDLEFEGPKRKAPNENLLRLQPPQIRQHQPSYGQELALIDPFNFMCKECPVYCSSELNLQMHYNGKKHQKRKHELASRGDEEGLGIKVCELCQVPCMNERAYQQHLVGKKHAAALRAIKISGSLRQVG